MKKRVLLIAILFMTVVFCGCERTEAIQSTMEAISQIGSISLDSGESIQKAENEYNALKKGWQKKIENIDSLIAAREEYDSLCVTEVYKQIDAIGEVSLQDEEIGARIDNARTAYDSLENRLQGNVDNYAALTEAEAKYLALRVAVVEDAISKIGEVTLSKAELVSEARETYNQADAITKDNVKNYNILTEAESIIFKLRIEEIEKYIEDIGEVSIRKKTSIEAARKKYDKADEEIKKQVSNYDILVKAEQKLIELEVIRIEEAINAIGTVTLESGDLIQKAAKYYESAWEEPKQKISNYDVVITAKETLTELSIQNAINLIDQIGTVTLSKENQIIEAENAYNSLDAAEQKKVTNYLSLTTAKLQFAKLKKEDAVSKLRKKYDAVENITWYESTAQPYYINSRSFFLPYIGVYDDGTTYLRIKADYTGDDWVFFEKLKIDIDGETYTKSFGYFGVNRENDYGDVWEVADWSPTKSEIEMLWEIVESEKTVVRFQGDYHHYDLTVSSTDKQAIEDVLTAYQYMK